MMNNLRPIGTQYMEQWKTYRNHYQNIYDSFDPVQIDQIVHTRLLEVIAHKEGKEICKIVEET